MDGNFEEIRYFSRKKKNLKRKKKKPLWRRIFLSLCAVAVSFFALAIIILNAVTPVIVSYAEAKIKSKSILAVNNAIFEVMTTAVTYSDLITVTKDGAGNIRLISANTQLINKLAQETALAANKHIAEIGEGIGIPVGTMTGIAAFVGRGPEIKIKAVPAGSAVCEFLSEFQEAGINQTRHKIYLEVLTLVVLVLPANRIEIYNTVQVLISENIIIGEVPDTFLKVSTLGGTSYNLIPS